MLQFTASQSQTGDWILVYVLPNIIPLFLGRYSSKADCYHAIHEQVLVTDTEFSIRFLSGDAVCP